MKPEQLDRSRESFSAFRDRLQPSATIDRYDLLLEDLFLIRNPRFKFIKDHTNEVKAFSEEYAAGKPTEEVGEWFFFPWNSTLAHYLPHDEHQEIRTARNRNIITKEEQEKFYGLRVAYAGLSVGSHGAMTAALMGGARRIKIADPDEVSPSNLNRIRSDFLAVGRKKTDLVREYIYQLNPYAEIETFESGVTEENINEFLKDMDVLVEETDDLEIKIRLRLAARERGIPVVMATDNGDGVIVEIERFDLDPSTKLFNEALGDITLEEFKSFSPHELPKLATKVAGADLVVPRMLLSLKEVGTTLYSWPQLGDAATLSGIAIAYCLRKIALQEPLGNGKLEINMDAIFDPTYNYADATQSREDVRTMFKRAIGLP
ncbi:ThiF family adenylyltransferase [Candidatus Kaiserbacteria bacterium]|nr:ThiF family adenylyltransferase [Candidatus Kaiserbacteria bacterium]